MSLGVIAAGGNGTRMNSNVPKPLTLLPDGDTFLDRMIKKFEGIVDDIVVVTNLAVMNHPKFTRNSNCLYRIQPHATGMGDAVFCASDLINDHDEILILWCDQIGVTRETILKTIDAHRKVNSSSHATIPSLRKDTKYIHIDYAEHHVKGIYQAREGDDVPVPSTSDIGLFMFSSGPNLLSAWAEGGREHSQGKITKEFNFLPFLTFLDSIGWSFQILEATPNDGLGVNTQEELINALEATHG
jgi:bifunctional N-acetylglucosamine-1-phosphate-uridyltransferase/glucosamine-1-phosphate-acetyltransferase GlmU-like protein